MVHKVEGMAGLGQSKKTFFRFVSLYCQNLFFMHLFCTFWGSYAMVLKRFFLLFILLWANFPLVCAQDSLWVRQIHLLGNKRTKAPIIFRELSFKESDSISAQNLTAFLEKEAHKVFNTDLFIEVKITHQIFSDNKVDILIQMHEKWYIFPAPIFELTDRNFSEWWVNQNRDLRRVEYGFMFDHENFRGRKERLKLLVQAGFMRKAEIKYSIPYIDKKQKLGLYLSLAYLENKNLNYATFDHRISSYSSSDLVLRKRFLGNIGLSYRPHYYQSHRLDLRLHTVSVDDSVLLLNPNYLPENLRFIRFFEAAYIFSFDNRDAARYPLKGALFTFSAQQRGLLPTDHVNQTIVKFRQTFHAPITKRFYFGQRVDLKFVLQNQQPYFLLSGLGYGEEFIRGYDLYVVETRHHLLQRNELKFSLLNKSFDFKKIIPIAQLNKVPLHILPKIYFDHGVSFNTPQNVNWSGPLNDGYLFGGGAGIDLVSYYTFIMRFEYSVNNLGQKGFFVGIGSAL